MFKICFNKITEIQIKRKDSRLQNTTEFFILQGLFNYILDFEAMEPTDPDDLLAISDARDPNRPRIHEVLISYHKASITWRL